MTLKINLYAGFSLLSPKWLVNLRPLRAYHSAPAVRV